MKTVQVLHHQNLMDICLQQYGHLDSLIALALANDIAVSDALLPGSMVLVPEGETNNTEILGFYASKSVIPATAIDDSILPIINNVDNCDLCQYFE